MEGGGVVDPCPHPLPIPTALLSSAQTLCRKSFFRDRVDSFLDKEKVQKDGDAINKEKGLAVMAIAQCRILQTKINKIQIIEKHLRICTKIANNFLGRATSSS